MILFLLPFALVALAVLRLGLGREVPAPSTPRTQQAQLAKNIDNGVVQAVDLSPGEGDVR